MDRAEVRREVEALVAAGDFDAAEELMAANWRLWLTSGDVEGGRALLAIVLDRDTTGATRGRALALYADGLLACRQGDRDGSLARNEEALEVARAACDVGAESLALVGLSRAPSRGSPRPESSSTPTTRSRSSSCGRVWCDEHTFVSRWVHRKWTCRNLDPLLCSASSRG